MFDFLRILIHYFDSNKIAYMLSGSVAMSLYVQPRFTRDYDFVVHLRDENIDDFLEYFKEGYYCDSDAIKDSIKQKSIFNIIDHATGFKADFIILKDEPFRQKEFERRQQADFFGIPIYLVSAEDLLLSKIIWIQDMQSGLQMEDIQNLKIVEGLDWHYINHWIAALKLNTFDLLL